MSFRLNKRIKISKGLGLNISKSGITPSYRTKRGSLSSKGYSVRTGIPGVSYRKTFKKAKNSGCLFIVIMLLCLPILLISCKNENKISREVENDYSPPKKEISVNVEGSQIFKDTIKKIAKPKNPHEAEINVFKEFEKLYRELNRFKSKNDFKKYGFSVNSPYHNWLKKVEKLKSHPSSKETLKKGFVVAELESLAFAYVASKGRETELTRFFNQIFSEGIK